MLDGGNTLVFEGQHKQAEKRTGDRSHACGSCM